MKTLNNQTRFFVKATVVLCFALQTFHLSAQNGVIWTQMPNIGSLEFDSHENRLYSSNTDLQNLINEYSILSIEYAVPASKKASLKNLVEITCNCDETELLVAVSKLPTLFVEPEIGPHYETLFVPNDYSIVFENDYALNLINAQQAWDITHGDSSIIIAISDQNFYIEHEDIEGKFHFYDTTNLSPQGHGTAVAITAAGNTNNSTGKSSIGYNSDLALYRMSYNDLLTATYNGYRVINTSWTSGCAPSDYVQNVINEIYENGSIVVAAAGNGGTCGGPTNLVYPAACNHVISVTSIGSTDNHELYAGDPNATHQHNSDIDISAPGLLVPISMAPGYYLVGNGSSFAAPFVSGTIALMLSVDTCLTFEDIETILYTTAVNIDSLNPQYAGLLGNGRLDAGAAVTMAASYMSCGVGNDPEPPVIHDQFNVNEEILEVTNSTASSEELGANEIIDFTLFPNPCSEGSAINLHSAYPIETCQITSIRGELIQTLVPHNNQLKIGNLSQGTYFVKVNFENGMTHTKRVIVK